MKSYLTLTSTLLLFYSLVIPHVAFGHGEDKPGPHGGAIRMPGMFHTEVVGLDKKKVAVYLLDFDFKEPTTENSSLKVSVMQESKTTPLMCETKEDHFICLCPSGLTLDKGTLEIVAKRKEAQGVAAEYPLPISIKP